MTTSTGPGNDGHDPLISGELDGYLVESVIGHGGMGIVYRATEVASGKAVALKVMIPEIARNPDFRERFTREAESGIDHPNIVPIYATGDADGLLYIAMRLVEGRDLKTIIGDEGRLLPARVVSIFAQAASALDAAHENGVVHRDVKPQNILIESGAEDESELVYLSDFGLVKRLSSQSSFTTSTYLMGSVQYMAPEQIEGRAVDGRADVYSLGCVLYEALTGSVPFPRETEVAALWAHVNEPPPSVTESVPILGDGVNAVVGKAMAKSPEDRYLTAGEMATALGAELGVSAGRIRSPWAGDIASSGRRRRPSLRRASPTRADSLFPKPVSRFKAALVGAVVMLLALGGARILDASISGGNKPSALEVLRALQSPEEPESQEVLDKLGDEIPALTKGSNPASQLSQRAAGSGLTNIGGAQPGNEAAKTPAGSSSGAVAPPGSTPPPVPQKSDVAIVGRQIVFVSDRGPDSKGNGVYIMNIDGSSVRTLYNSGADDYGISLSPNRRKLALSIGWDLYVMNVDGSALHRLTSGVWARDAEWSPDGTKIAYAANPTRNKPAPAHGWEIYVTNGDGSGDPINVSNSVGWDRNPTWSPDGGRIAFESERGVDEGDIIAVDADGSNPTRITNSGTEYDYEPDWSPDGNMIAFARTSGYDATAAYNAYTSDLYIVDLTTSQVEMIYDAKNWYAGGPEWSASGHRIAFYTDFFRDYGDITTIRPDGTGVRRVTRYRGLDMTPTW